MMNQIDLDQVVAALKQDDEFIKRITDAVIVRMSESREIKVNTDSIGSSAFSDYRIHLNSMSDAAYEQVKAVLGE